MCSITTCVVSSICSDNQHVKLKVDKRQHSKLPNPWSMSTTKSLENVMQTSTIPFFQWRPRLWFRSLFPCFQLPKILNKVIDCGTLCRISIIWTWCSPTMQTIWHIEWNWFFLIGSCVSTYQELNCHLWPGVRNTESSNAQPSHQFFCWSHLPLPVFSIHTPKVILLSWTQLMDAGHGDLCLERCKNNKKSRIQYQQSFCSFLVHILWFYTRCLVASEANLDMKLWPYVRQGCI